MKNTLRPLFSFILKPFESGTKGFNYQKSHRVILIIMGFLFIALATAVFFMVPAENVSYYFPVLIFGSMGMLGFIIGFLGNKRAVATIWGNTDR